MSTWVGVFACELGFRPVAERIPRRCRADFPSG